jgi:hypothetical protein
MSGKSVIGSIIGSILITLGIIWGLGFIGFFPGVDTKNNLIQTQYGEWNSPAYIYDNQLSYVKMTDTELNVTTSGNSRLLATFSAMSIMTLGPDFRYRVGYNISLIVHGIGNRTIQADFFDGSPATSYTRQISIGLFINFMTPNLPAGTYNINVYWKSGFNANGTTNSLSVAHIGVSSDYNFTRTLLVQELRN